MMYAQDRHQPYVRLEYATRPEYPRTDGIFRYEHDSEPEGATRWLIATAAYGHQVSAYPVSFRPFLEVQYHRARAHRIEDSADMAFRTGSFWALSLGARLFLGGGPMRMGSYGALDAMTSMGRTMPMHSMAH